MADPKQARIDFVKRLLNDSDFFDLFLKDPDAALAEFPDVNRFDAKFLKENIDDWDSLTAVAQRFDVPVPERPSEPEPPPNDLPLRLQAVLQLDEDPEFSQFFQKDPEAALAEYPELPEKQVEDIIKAVKDTPSLKNVIDRYASTVRKGLETGSAPSAGEAAPETEPRRVVNTGFATESDPAQPITDLHTPLHTAQAYYFWFEVGEPVAGSMALDEYELPTDKLPPEARLQVALFSYDGELEITRGADVGDIQLSPEGEVRVVRAVHEPDGVPAEMLAQRLFFPVRVPAQPGYHRLRCNVYFRQTLVQSHLIIVRAAAAPQTMSQQVLRQLMDYNLSKNLNGHQLAGMGENKLSIMVNANGNGTHGFRFFGQQEFKNDAALGEGAVTDLLNSVRGALRKAAWGDEEPYQKGKQYRYEDGLDEARLRGDLVTMALRGFRAFDALINQIAGDADKAWDLMEFMVRPGQVQIASKQAANLVLPAAMFYDYPLDDGRKTADYKICSAFMDALQGEDPLEACACFQGDCPTYDDDVTICPSGFWGFRHALGLPLSVRAAPDAPVAIPSTGPAKLAVSVSTDPNFKERAGHEQRLQGMGFGWEHADSRDESVDLLKQTESQVVYFYCHGGLHDNLPYLSVGPVGSERFTRSIIRSKRIRWQKVRPLVFINGCHTTQLTPERALDLVSAFVENARAAGVVGTEITIFEPIAVEFAEECFRRFLIEKQTLGEAVRGARLKMLKNGNPLGLVYIPYALAGLKLT